MDGIFATNTSPSAVSLERQLGRTSSTSRVMVFPVTSYWLATIIVNREIRGRKLTSLDEDLHVYG